MNSSPPHKIILNLKPWQKILFALCLGLLTGILFGPKVEGLRIIGVLFIHAINLLVVPVVFTSIVSAVLAMDDLKKMRRITMKAFLVYAISMAVAAVIGLSIATIIAPGAGLAGMSFNALVDSNSITQAPTLSELIINIIPTNPVSAFAAGNILQILVFAIVIGIAVQMAGAKGEIVATLLKSSAAVSIQLTQLVMRFAPLGIFALMAWVSGVYGLNVLLPLFKLVMTIYLGCLILNIFFYALSLLCIARINPWRFFKAVAEALLLAFSTSSSAATLPVTLNCAQEKLGISKRLSGFLLPLGTTMNLNGLSVYLSVAVVFAANMQGMELSFMQYLTVILTIILTAMGAGGIPGSTIVVLGAVLSAVGLPLTAVTLIAGVDRLNDMAGTTTNVAGDLYATAIVAKSEGENLLSS